MSSNKMSEYCTLNNIKSKIKAEDERKIRGLSFAKLYFANKDYEKALTYVNEYLTVKNNSAEAYRVLGDIYEALDNNEKSYEAYKKSYYIDKNQDSLLFKICSKLENLNADTQIIKSWLDRLEKKYPNHQSVFNLRDKLQLENGNSSHRLEDTFRDLSNVKLADLTDDKCANLSCSFLNSRSSPALTPNHFKTLERSQDRLLKKVNDIEEHFDKTTNQILEIVKENQAIFGQLKSEMDKINLSLGKLQLGQSELKESIDVYINGDYDNEEDDEEEEEDFEEIQGDENDQQQNISASFISCSSTGNQDTSDVFARLGPQKPKSANNSFNQPPQISHKTFTVPPANNQSAQLLPIQSSALNIPSSSNKSPLEQMSATISKIGHNTPTTAPIDSTHPSTTSVKKTAQDSTVPLSEIFKDQYKGKWQCEACYCQNDFNLVKCLACETPKDGTAHPPPTQLQPTAPALNKPFAFNTNPNTGGFSFAQAIQQISPQKPQPIANPPVTSTTTDNKFVFGAPAFAPSINQPSSTSFTFNSSQLFGPQTPATAQQTPNAQLPATLFSPSKQTPQQPPVFPANLGSSSFVFSGQNTMSTLQPNLAPPVFGIQSPVKSIIPPSVEDKSERVSAEEKAIADGVDEPQVEFKPVIPLPPKVKVITGEENEKVLFQHRAKLFRFMENEWKERGLGDIKILYDEQNNRYRLLMRREQIHKVCLNTPLSSTFEFNSGTNAAGNMLRFGCCDFSDGEQGKAEVLALRFKTRETTDRFRNEVYAVVKMIGGNPPSVKPVSIASTTKPTPTKNEDAKVASSSFTQYDDVEIVYVKEPKSKEERDLAEKLKLPVNFFNYNDANCPGCHGCNEYIPKLRCELAKKDDKENVEEPLKQEETNSENLFSSAMLANVAKTSWSTTGEQPKWMKTNSIFSWNQTPSAGGETANNENNPEADLVTLDFKPVVPLPDLIEVRTGEEDEEVLFSSRAKLYKYTGKEWKERGLGDFKVLRHNQTKKIRFLMRRDQVHKICLNHIVDKNLKISRRKDRDTIYQWSATDFSDDAAGTPSNFNVKFKTIEICRKLMQTLKDHVEGFEETIFQ